MIDGDIFDIGGDVVESELLAYSNYPAYARFERQTDNQLLKSIRSIEKELIKHRAKIENPRDYVSDWEKRSTYYHEGILKRWEKEISNFEMEIRIGKLLAEERGINNV